MFNNFKSVISAYPSNQLQVVIHLFPLPYHTYSFLISQSVYIVADKELHNAYKWIDLLFQNQDKYQNDILICNSYKLSN